MKKLWVFLCVTMMVFSLAPVASAVSVPVSNSSFEAPIEGDGGFGTSITDWFSSGAGVWDPLAPIPYTDPIPDGDQVAYASTNGWLYQDLGEVFTAGRTYFLNVSVGNRNDTDFPGFGVAIRRADTNVTLAEVTGPTPAEGEWDPVQVSFAAQASQDYLGEELRIVLYAKDGSGQVNFDDVSVAYIPEPTSLLLIGSGLLGLIGVRKLKKG